MTEGWYQNPRKVSGDGLRKLDWTADSHGVNVWLAYHSKAGADFACFDGWPLDSDTWGDDLLGCQRFDRVCHVEMVGTGSGCTPDTGDEELEEIVAYLLMQVARDRRRK
jgi:hypothetical protein